jgi:HEAT repeat protein
MPPRESTRTRRPRRPALGASGDKDAVPALVEALKDRDKVVVWDAITALGMLGPRATAAKDPLEILAKDRGKAARARAALRRIGL